MPVADLCRKLGVSEPTYYRWKKMYGSLECSVAGVARVHAVGGFNPSVCGGGASWRCS